MHDKILLFLIGVINFIGFLYGMYYYSGQLSEWNPLYWILIIDCPLQALLVGLILVHEARAGYEKENNMENPAEDEFFRFLVNFTSLGSIKYGIWTMFVILFYHNFFLFSDPFTYLILFLAHLGLALEGLALTGFEMKKRDLFIITGFYLLNDASDYLIGTHPVIPHEGIEIIAMVTLSLTFICSYLVWKSGKEKRNLLSEINRKRIHSEFISKFLSLLKSK